MLILGLASKAENNAKAYLPSKLRILSMRLCRARVLSYCPGVGRLLLSFLRANLDLLLTTLSLLCLRSCLVLHLGDLWGTWEFRILVVNKDV